MDPQRTNEAKEERSSRTGLRLEALASGFVALLALLISAYTVYVQRLQLKVQAWPRLALVGESSPGQGTDGPHLTVSLKNRGVAPAEVRAMRLVFAGEELPDYREWVMRILKKFPAAKGSFFFSKVGVPNGQVIGVGDQVLLYATDSVQMAAVLEAASEETSLSFCYCSVLDDCWVLEEPAGETALETTQPVSKCPTYATRFSGIPEGANRDWAASILAGDSGVGVPTDASTSDR